MTVNQSIGSHGSNPRHQAPVAVVDVGSNSVRLVVYESASRAPIPVFNERALCGLGRGLGENGQLPDTAVENAHQTLERFAALCQAMGVTHVHAIATAAVREAENGAAFVDDVEKRCGLRIQVLSGAEEARISALGVVSAFPAADGVMADLGGASVELGELDGGHIKTLETFPIGPLRSRDTQRIEFDTDAGVVDGISRSGLFAQARGKRFYAVGGAWRALAQIHMTQRNYPLRVVHGYAIPARDAHDFMSMIAGLGRSTLRRIPGIDRRRIEVIPYAATLLTRLLEAARPKEVVFSAFGVREGCLYEQLDADARQQDPLISACRSIALRDGHAASEGEAVFRWMSPLFAEETDEEMQLRQAASLLADIAWSEHPVYRVEHAFLRVLRLPIVGIDHPGRASIALAVAAQHAPVDERLVEQYIHGLIEDATVERARTIGLALRLAYTLCGGVTAVLEESPLRCDAETLTLVLPAIHATLAGDIVTRRLQSLAKLLGRKAAVEVGTDLAAPRQQGARAGGT